MCVPECQAQHREVKDAAQIVTANVPALVGSSQTSAGIWSEGGLIFYY